MCSPCVCFHIPPRSLCLDHTEMSTTDFLSELGRPNSKVVCLSHCAGTLIHTYPDRPSPASPGTLTSCPTRPMEPSQIPCDSMIFPHQVWFNPLMSFRKIPQSHDCPHIWRQPLCDCYPKLFLFISKIPGFFNYFSLKLGFRFFTCG